MLCNGRCTVGDEQCSAVLWHVRQGGHVVMWLRCAQLCTRRSVSGCRFSDSELPMCMGLCVSCGLLAGTSEGPVHAGWQVPNHALRQGGA